MLRLEAQDREAPTVRDFRHQVGTLVVIASSSRGGSSVLAEMLRSSPRLLHFRAEVNPFFVLAGLGYPTSTAASDQLEATHVGRESSVRALDHYLALDCGQPSGDLPREDDSSLVDALALELARRLTLQWPHESFDLPQVRDAVLDALPACPPGQGVQHGVEEFHAAFLRRIRARHPAVDPWYYDLPPASIERHHPDLSPPAGPPSSVAIEEPPFVTVRPWMRATPSMLGTLPVVMKTPSNAYRLDFLRAFFPHARLRILHLVRNASASINGLVDGWCYRGFFAHVLDRTLGIGGYSDRYPWGRHWWKFDLPPGWEAFTNRSLVEVCGFQWLSAHRATLSYLERAGHREEDVLRLRFEDVVGDESRRREAFGRLARWLDIPLDGPLEALVREGAPPVMATLPPRQRRWFQRADLLEPVLSSPPITEMMERLGYDVDPDTWL